MKMSGEELLSFGRGVKLALGISAAFIVCLILSVDFFKAYIDTDFRLTSSTLVFGFYILFIPGVWSQWKARQFVLRVKLWQMLCFIIMPLITHGVIFLTITYGLSTLIKENEFAIEYLVSFVVIDHRYLLLFFYAFSAVCVDLIYHKRVLEKHAEGTHPIHADSITVIKGKKNEQISFSIICYVTANNFNSLIHTIDKQFFYLEPLNKLEQKLPGKYFARISSSTIVNLMHVSRYVVLFNGEYDIVLTNNTVVRMFNRYVNVFIERYDSLKGEIYIRQ